MAIVKKCCCFDVRTGTQIMVSFHLVMVMADFGLTVYQCVALQTDVLRQILSEYIGYPEEYWTVVLLVAYALLVTYFVSMVFSAILAMYSWCTNPDSRCLLWLWLIAQAILTVVGLGLNIAFIVLLAKPGEGLWRTYFTPAIQFLAHIVFTILTAIVIISHLQNLKQGLGKNIRIYFSSLVPRDLTTRQNKNAYRTRTESGSSNAGAIAISNMTEVGHSANVFDLRTAPVKMP